MRRRVLALPLHQSNVGISERVEVDLASQWIGREQRIDSLVDIILQM